MFRPTIYIVVLICIELTLRTSMHTEAINLRLNREELHCIGITQPGTKIARKPTSHPRMGSNPITHDWIRHVHHLLGLLGKSKSKGSTVYQPTALDTHSKERTQQRDISSPTH